jgi:hypothetical protein
MWTRGRFVNEYVPGLFTLAVDSYLAAHAESMWPELVNVKTSKKKKEEDAIRSGLGLPVAKGEGAGITYDTQISGAKQTWIHNVYALGVRITEEAIEDNLYELGGGGSADDLNEIFEDLGQSMNENIETLMARFFNYATATTYHTTRDSVAFCSASHARLDGSTYSNYATSTDLTYSTFWANLIAAENQLNHRQHRVKKKVSKLWIPPQYEQKAREILQSPDRPDTGNRAVSAYAKSGRNIKIMSWPHMTDTDSFVLQCEGRGIVFFWRRKTRFAREKDFGTGDFMCKADQRFSAEIADERDFYFNVPA